MKKIENDYILSEDGFPVAFAYFPVENSKAIIQIVHGMMEYKERYFEFINFLNEAGYSCIISDHRGHGHSVNRRYPFGHMENPAELLNDLKAISRFAQSQEPNKPLVLFGHSMGSILARNYLMNEDKQLSLLLLTGTPQPEKIAGLGVLLCQMIIALSGSFGRSRLLTSLLPTNKPASQWIAHNKTHLQNLKKEHLSHIRFDNGAIYTLIKLVQQLAQPKLYQVKNPQLPIYSFSGEDDLITGGKKGLEASKKALEKIGYTNIQIKEYPQMMHEIFKEEKKEQVFQDILSVLDTYFA